MTDNRVGITPAEIDLIYQRNWPGVSLLVVARDWNSWPTFLTKGREGDPGDPSESIGAFVDRHLKEYREEQSSGGHDPGMQFMLYDGRGGKRVYDVGLPDKSQRVIDEMRSEIRNMGFDLDKTIRKPMAGSPTTGRSVGP